MSKIPKYSLLVSILILLSGLFIPEIRYFLGLENRYLEEYGETPVVLTEEKVDSSATSLKSILEIRRRIKNANDSQPFDIDCVFFQTAEKSTRARIICDCMFTNKSSSLIVLSFSGYSGIHGRLIDAEGEQARLADVNINGKDRKEGESYWRLSPSIPMRVIFTFYHKTVHKELRTIELTYYDDSFTKQWSKEMKWENIRLGPLIEPDFYPHQHPHFHD